MLNSGTHAENPMTSSRWLMGLPPRFIMKQSEAFFLGSLQDSQCSAQAVLKGFLFFGLDGAEMVSPDSELYRLLSPFEGNETAWMIVSEDRATAMVAYFRVLAEPYAPFRWLRLKGLDPHGDYKVEGAGEVFPGDHLLHAGLPLPITKLKGDFQSKLWLLRRQP